jgi:hypothetical protein
METPLVMKLYSYALTLFHTIIKQTTPEINEASRTSQNQQGETNVNNDLGKFQEPSAIDNSYLILDKLTHVDSIIRLWILRLLIPLECHRKFIRKNDFNNDEIARLFALQADSDEADYDDDVEQALKCALNLCDSHYPNKSEGDQAEQQYDPKQALHQLKNCYKAAEQNASKIALPQPLTGNIQSLAKQVGLIEIECAIWHSRY